MNLNNIDEETVKKSGKLSSELLSELKDATVEMITKVEEVSNKDKYKNLPNTIKAAMLMVAVQILYQSLEKSDPVLFKIAKELTFFNKNNNV